MASTYSSNLKIELMGTGENAGTWGNITNTNLGTALEQAVVGYGNPDFTSDANLTISITNSNAAQAARALVLNVTSVFGSLTATRELIVPTSQKQYIVQNNTTGGQSITVKTSGGTGITVPNGRKAHLYVDGTNVVQMFDFVDINGGAIDGTTVGAAAASTGAFTNLSASGTLGVTGVATLGAGAVLNTPASVTLTNATGLPISSGVSGLGTGVATFLATPSSANLAAAVTDETGTGSLVFATSPTLVTPALGTPASGVLTNATGLPISTGVSGLGTGIATFLGTPSSANLAAAVTDETGTGALVFATSPTFVTPILGTPTSGTVTNLTGTASININGTVGATTPAAGAFTTLTTSGAVTFNDAGAAVDFRVEGDTDANLLFVDASADIVGIGTGTPSTAYKLTVAEKINIASGADVTPDANWSGQLNISGNGYAGGLALNAAGIWLGNNSATRAVILATDETERMRIDGAGNVGIGTTSPDANLTVNGAASFAAGTALLPSIARAGDLNTGIFFPAADQVGIATNGVERVEFGNSETVFNDSGADVDFRVESDTITHALFVDGGTGNVGLGTATPAQRLDVNGNVFSNGILRMTDGGTAASPSIQPGNDGDTGLFLPAANTIGFATTGSEAMRVDASGNFFVAKTSSNRATAGFEALAGGTTQVTNLAAAVFNVNRQTDDGTLVVFYQANTAEGNISVSGTTVSYNGGHLSRWAQTTTAKDESLVKGTVLSNLDEMNVYTDAEGNTVENEQLNKVKVSDVEGDANVAGVFVNWDHDDAHNVDEINMAMTGDMIIRIAQGVTVARGDLLMSAGDGTAKPQGDDIVRSKTIAKVTSTHVTCTYADGSFCVPCVLMAC